jgi:hypothetical protein
MGAIQDSPEGKMPTRAMSKADNGEMPIRKMTDAPGEMPFADMSHGSDNQMPRPGMNK